MERILTKTWKAKNLQKLYVFGKFLVVWGGPSGAIWRPSWAMLAHLGDKMGYTGPSWRYLAPSRRQDATYERQDEPRWRPRAPRGANLGPKSSQHKSASPPLKRIRRKPDRSPPSNFPPKTHFVQTQPNCNVRFCTSASRHPPGPGRGATWRLPSLHPPLGRTILQKRSARPALPVIRQPPRRTAAPRPLPLHPL